MILRTSSLCFPSTDFSQASTVARDFFRESVKVSASCFNSFMESSVNKLKSGHSKILFSERTISSSVFLFSSSDSKLFSCFAVSFSTEILLSKSDFAFESSLCARLISDLICSALSAQAFAAFKSSSTDEYFISALRLSVSSFAELYLLFASAFLRINSV